MNDNLEKVSSPPKCIMADLQLQNGPLIQILISVVALAMHLFANILEEFIACFTNVIAI